MNEPMQTATTSMLRRKTGELLKLAEERPILMSADHYERINGKEIKGS